MSRRFLSVPLWGWAAALIALLWLGHATGNCVLCKRYKDADQ